MNKNMKSLRRLALMLAVGIFPALLSSQAKPDSLSLGTAQVDGKIHLVARDPAASLAEFTIASADTGVVQTKIAFKSTRTVVQNDEIDVIGDLTLTLLERTATCCNPSEDYAGPLHGETAAKYVTRQVVFVFPKEKLLHPSVSGEISATALIAFENFPELLPAIYALNRPPGVQDERCEMPSSTGEDYAGPSCEKTMVAANQVKIVLSLRVTEEGARGTSSLLLINPSNHDSGSAWIHL